MKHLVLVAASSLLVAAPAQPSAPLTMQHERDMLYTWLAYAVVYHDWQPTAQPDSSRGFNIGSVLVNSEGYVVHWARNSVNAARNATQHGEVRLIQGYLQRTRQFSLKGCTIYTTLEPCAMCSGMMTLTQVKRTQYGQADPDYGDALQRLQLDSRRLGAQGYGPYPRAVTVGQTAEPVSCGLDSAYARHRTQRIVDFLASAPARQLYRAATLRLSSYQARYPENQVRLDSARRFLARIPQQFTE